MEEFRAHDHGFSLHMQGLSLLCGAEGSKPLGSSAHLPVLLTRATESLGLAGPLQAPYSSEHMGPLGLDPGPHLRKGLNPQLGRVSWLWAGRTATANRGQGAAE